MFHIKIRILLTFCKACVINDMIIARRADFRVGRWGGGQCECSGEHEPTSGVREHATPGKFEL